MGIIQSKKDNIIKKERYANICKKNGIELQKLYIEIKSLREKLKVLGDKLKIKNDAINEIQNDTINDTKNDINKEIIQINNKLISLYEKIFEYDNTKEDDNLEYLLLFNQQYQKGIIDKKAMKTKLDIYNIFISDDNYNNNFPEFERKNSREKIFCLILLIKDIDLANDENRKKGKDFIKSLEELNEEIDSFNIKFKRQITWENKQLFLYNLYMSLVESFKQKINYYKNSFSPKASESKIFHELYEKYIIKRSQGEEEEKKKILKELNLVKLIEGEFIPLYISNLKYFLECVHSKFEKKFKNNTFKDEEDKNIFEDYIQFLISYDFEIFNKKFINLWNETFIPSEEKDIKKNIELYNDDQAKFNLELKNNELTINNNGKIIHINDIKCYNIKNLISDISLKVPPNLDYILNKNLKPNFYYKKLFINEKKEIWKELTIKIISSSAIKEVQEIVFKDSYIDFLNDQDYLSQLLDNVKFFIYKTNYAANTNKNSLRIYEFGLYRNNKNKSLSLVLFYCFNVISNIHEICGHVNIRIQNLNSLDNSVDSPEIEDNISDLYSEYGRLRKREAGETIEILLFGRKVEEITINEALFILNPFNYKNGKDKFKEGFSKCNNKNLEDLVNKIVDEAYFKPLGIKIAELPKNAHTYYSSKINVNKENKNTKFNRGVSDHPPEFYYEIDKEFFKELLKEEK